jgi:hypothetical protein
MHNAALYGYLVDTYEGLALATNGELSAEEENKMRLALAKIQLFGSKKEIDLVNKFFDEWQRQQPDGRPRASLDPLLFEIRNSIRGRLDLDPVESPIHWLRPRGGLR